MFLVLFRSALDDLPCGLFRTRGEAEVFAETLTDGPPESVLKVFNLDIGTACNVSIVEFAGRFPVKCTLVEDLSDLVTWD